MKLQDNPYIPLEWKDAQRQLDRLYRETAQQVNQLAGGLVQASINATTGAPTTGSWSVGDVIRNVAPSELGAPGSKYIITHWTCVTSGTPGTWLQCRSLTGN